MHDVKNILVVDDERRFRALEARENTEVFYARDIETAKKLIYTLAWDEVWLDNDFGERMDGHFLEYADVQRSLVRNIEEDTATTEGWRLRVDKFVIHTQNPVARFIMQDSLSKFYNVEVVYDINPYL